jgi:hypothetical protein
MVQLYTVDELIESIKNRITISNTSASGSGDDDIIRFLNEAMEEILMPMIMRVKEEYFVVTEHWPILSGQARYRLPTRAIGQKLRDLMLRDNSTNPNRISLARINRENLSQMDGLATQTNASCFYMEGDYIVLVPNISANPSGTLEVSYFFRPGELVTSDNFRLITNVDLVNNIVTVATTPTGWDTTKLYDIHGSNSGAEIRFYNLAASVVAANQFTFTTSLNKTDLRDSVVIGDYLVLAGTSALPAIPLELQPVLIQAVVCMLAEQQGDAELFQIHSARLKDIIEASTYMIDDRVEGRPQKVIGGALLRAGRYSGIRTSRNIN